MSGPIYVIADIHGQLDALEQALTRIDADGGADAETVFLGDLVDRGPDSRGVVERLMAGQVSGRRWRVLKGNHDRMFERFVRTGVQLDERIKATGLVWLHSRLGGQETLASYGIDDAGSMPPERAFAAAGEAVPAAHLDFIDRMPLFHRHGALLFVHAGILPGVTLEAQVEDDLVWIRDPFLNDTRAHPWLVVHGHTALEQPHHFGNRIDLDGGAGYGRPLYPAVFEGSDCWLLTETGRRALIPGEAFVPRDGRV